MIHATNINIPVEQYQLDKFVEILSPNKRQHIERYHFRNDYLRSLYGEVMVRKAIERKTGIEDKAITFHYNKYGKPYIYDLPNIHFNISHSGDWVVCVLSGFRCGIDIEEITKPHLDIAKRYFTKAEYETLNSMSGDAQKEYFYDLWTLKESYIKWMGKGLMVPLNSFEFEKKDGRYIINNYSDNQLRFKQFKIADGYKMALCSEEDINDINYVDMREL